ncbi:recombinase family protein [Streptomyces sp. NPDC017179]|uniref:recombinase family protein n=1 Tax=Streptomyces sp. NPDC017179 TaxID=3364979 RepID=UPI0037AE8B1C
MTFDDGLDDTRGPMRRQERGTAWPISSASGCRPTSSRLTVRTSSWPKPGSRTLVVFEEAAGTSCRLHPLERPKFGDLLTYARPGDTVHISEMFRLVRGTGHIVDILDVLHRDQVACASRRRVLRHGPHRPPPADRRAAVHREVHGADPRRRRRTPARPPTGADLRRTAGCRGQGQQGRTPPRPCRRDDHRRAHRLPGGPVHRRLGPRAQRQPRRRAHRRRRSSARARR